MPRKNQIWDPTTMKALEGIRIPDKLKCDRCNKYKGHKAFSNKQLTDARYAVKHQGQSATYTIKCMQCTGAQPVEIECTVCGITKGLEAFAKSQRTKIDRAECFKCTERRLNVDPYTESKYQAENRSHAFSHEDESQFQPSVFDVSTASDASSEWFESGVNDSAPGGGVSLSEDFTRISLIANDTSQAGALIGREFARDGEATQSDGWQMVGQRSRGSWHTPSGHSGTQSTSIEFNPNAYGNPASLSACGSQRSFNSSMAERSDDTAMSAKGNFAKIKAYIPPKVDWSSDEEEPDQDAASDDDDDDDSDDEL